METFDEKVKYLKKYRVLQIEADKIDNEMRRWRSVREKITPSYLPTTGSDGNGSRLEVGTEEIIALESSFKIKIRECVQIRMEIENYLCSISDYNARLLLELKYVEGYLVEEIANYLHYSRQQVWRLHKKAIKMLHNVT